jgi:hypothetical protein
VFGLYLVERRQILIEHDLGVAHDVDHAFDVVDGGKGVHDGATRRV